MNILISLAHVYAQTSMASRYSKVCLQSFLCAGVAHTHVLQLRKTHTYLSNATVGFFLPFLYYFTLDVVIYKHAQSLH